jgi:L-gulonolactone oxidase
VYEVVCALIVMKLMNAVQAAKVVYPTTEAEIVQAVADAARANQKIKVATQYGHSAPKLACPGSDSGVIISSKHYNSIVSIDKVGNTVTAQSGIIMSALIDGMAAEGLALTAAPLFAGVTLGGATANSVSGSSMWGKGGALHEYVVAMTLVTPATAAEGFATVRALGAGDPDLNAAKVHLGVLGVVSTITLQVSEFLFLPVTTLNR